jgi:PAS domain S-box-containing protein
LLIEDNPGDARLIEVLLAEADTGFEVEWVTRLADGVERLRDGERSVDAVLLDLALPDSSGFDTFAAVNASAPRVPIILLTGLDDEELAVRAVRLGAQDYLTKGRVDGPLLARAIHYAIERRQAEDALRRSEETLRLAMEASESGVWDLDVRSGMVTASAGCQAMLGFDAVETVDNLESFWTSMLHPDDRKAALRDLTDTLEGRSPFFESDHRLRAREGWVWVHAKGRVVEYSAGREPVRFIMTRTNITARKTAEEAAVENARMFEQQRRIATTLQENFVHPLPPVQGLDLGVVAQTANEPELVGGDFSDVFLLPGAGVAVLVGDVAGKGIGAAGLTETVRSTVRAFAMVDSSPAFILRKTNEVLLQRNAPWDFVTAVLLVLDTATGHATYVSAGHPLPVHLAAGSCSLLQAPGGHPLGAFSADYVDTHVVIASGDYLVLYTDGVVEARRNG